MADLLTCFKYIHLSWEHLITSLSLSLSITCTGGNPSSRVLLFSPAVAGWAGSRPLPCALEKEQASADEVKGQADKIVAEATAASEKISAAAEKKAASLQAAAQKKAAEVTKAADGKASGLSKQADKLSPK